ncbi:hypothetical protein T484DRAFT_1763543 [Baffinella frigidus]|nr:hypothetical protein T484DRAFT_1763543 [Cryptophyta sp. CCMP2293]
MSRYSSRGTQQLGVEWHATHHLDLMDPYLGTARRVNYRWTSRRDYGDGQPLDSAAALAIAVGVVFHAAVEAGGSLEGGAVVGALRSLDITTFFGRVRFGTSCGAGALRSLDITTFFGHVRFGRSPQL